MHLSIATKLFLAFAAVIIIFTCVIMAGIWRSQAFYDQIQSLNRTIVPLSLVLSDAQNDIKSFDVILSERNLEPLQRTLQVTRIMSLVPQRIITKVQRALNLAKRPEIESLSLDDRARLKNLSLRLNILSARLTTFESKTLRLHNLLQARSTTQDEQTNIRSIQAELRLDTRTLDTSFTRLRNDLRISTDLAIVRAREYERSNILGLTIMSALAIVCALALLAFALLTIRPLHSLTEDIKRVAHGQYHALTTQPRAYIGRDEVAILTDEFNAMAHSLQERDQTLRQQHEALIKSERLATIGRMTSLITHELRNPLSSIGLNAEMLSDALMNPDPTQQHELLAHLDTIIREVDRLNEITEEYLVYARLPSPKLEVAELSDILEHLIDFHAFEWREHDVQIDFTPPNHPIPLHADPNQIRQALLNLIKNAVEASPPSAYVSIHVHMEHDIVSIDVTDQGAGIAEEIQPSILEPFFTSKSKGTGLGLAMTQQIIEEHQGKLTFTSIPDQGTTFTIELPMHNPEPFL